MAIEFETIEDVKCPHCGEPVESIDEIICPHCNKGMEESMYHCECGQRFHLAKEINFCFKCRRPVKREESTQSQKTVGL